jgi:adenosylhomocysteine nucleosidase
VIHRASILLAAALVGAPGAGSSSTEPDPGGVVVLVSANAEWKVVRARYASAAVSTTPFGEWFTLEVPVSGRSRRVVFFHGGWGKIAAAGSTQYAALRWKPGLLVNLGTCGGFEGAVRKGEVLLVDKTIVYDIVEMMGDSAEAIAEYTTPIDVAWAGSSLPEGVRRGLLLSADRDIQVGDISRLRSAYGAVAADWESGAIAWVARANGVPVLILRGVTDLVGTGGGEAYGNIGVFEEGTRAVMNRLMDELPSWLARWEAARPGR